MLEGVNFNAEKIYNISGLHYTDYDIPEIHRKEINFSPGQKQRQHNTGCFWH